MIASTPWLYWGLLISVSFLEAGDGGCSAEIGEVDDESIDEGKNSKESCATDNRVTDKLVYMRRDSLIA